MKKDCVLNELSLSGQYFGLEDFIVRGARAISAILSELRVLGFHVLYKKSDVYNAQVSSGLTLNQVLIRKENRAKDELKKLKSTLAGLQNEPFWDNNPCQDLGGTYMVINGLDSPIDVSGSGIAEACARKAYLLSFPLSKYDFTPILIQKDSDESINVDNIWQPGQLVDLMFDARQITPDDYFAVKYSSKFDFSRIKRGFGFNLVDKNNIRLFDTAFKKIERLQWATIFSDDGLDYKKFSKNKNTRDFFSKEEWDKQIMKFRVNDEIRCFGYVEDGKFFLLRIDLNHKLSDLG